MALIKMLSPVIKRFILRWSSNDAVRSELETELVMACLKAIEKADTSRPNRLVSYAASWIKLYAYQFIYSQHAFKLTRSGRLRSAISEVKNSLDVESVALDKASKKYNVDEQLIYIMMHSSPKTLAYSNDGEDNFIYQLADENSLEDQYQELEDGLTNKKRINEALGCLSPRERDIVVSNIMLDKPESLEELSKKYGVSRERIRQIREKAKGKMKKHLEKT
jgi:RNA polymerase sigma-32 factor